jgi:hypothetical protein
VCRNGHLIVREDTVLAVRGQTLRSVDEDPGQAGIDVLGDRLMSRLSCVNAPDGQMKVGA